MKVTDHLGKYHAINDEKKRYNCAELVFLSANDAWDLGKHDAVNLMRGFGGGMNVGIACGAVTGGIAAIGCKYEDMKLIRAKTKLFIETVRERAGSENCIPLREKYATEKDGCKPTIQFIAEILDEVDAAEIVFEE